MDEATYEQVSAQLVTLVSKQPAFIANVKLNVPGEIQQEVIELHAVVQP